VKEIKLVNELIGLNRKIHTKPSPPTKKHRSLVTLSLENGEAEAELYANCRIPDSQSIPLTSRAHSMALLKKNQR
jgi:hypothetical protein